MTAVCPYCEREERSGLLCLGCTATLRYELGDVRSIVHQLDFTISRQTRIQAATSAQERPETAEDETISSGLAHERIPIHMGAVQAADDLAQALTHWARSVSNWTWNPALYIHEPAAAAAHYLRDHTPEIRRHPNVTELVDGCLDAIRHARDTTDHPAMRRIDVGPCPEDTENGPCPGTVQAHIPANDRPAWMTCKANPGHHWSSIQFFRLGPRIEKRRQQQGAA